MLELTKDELRNILWMCEKTAAELALRDLKNGKKPAENKTRNRVLSVSRKVYRELVERNMREESCE